MEFRKSSIENLRSLGYTQDEARFLYLVAMHSGYFSARRSSAAADLLPANASRFAPPAGPLKQFVYRSVTFLRQTTIHTFLALLPRNRAHLRLYEPCSFIGKEEDIDARKIGIFIFRVGKYGFPCGFWQRFIQCSPRRYVRPSGTPVPVGEYSEPFPLTPLTGLSKIFTNHHWTFDEWRRLKWMPF
jgi:hypothetical protein